MRASCLKLGQEKHERGRVGVSGESARNGASRCPGPGVASLILLPLGARSQLHQAEPSWVYAGYGGTRCPFHPPLVTDPGCTRLCLVPTACLDKRPGLSYEQHGESRGRGGTEVCLSSPGVFPLVASYIPGTDMLVFPAGESVRGANHSFFSSPPPELMGESSELLVYL